MTLDSKRILVIEDSVLIGEVVADLISEAGGLPIGPVLSEEEALDMINYNPGVPDAAIVDLHLDHDRDVGLVARRLDELGVPFVFATGQPEDVPFELRHYPVCPKPYSRAEILAALTAVIARPRVAH